MAYASAPEDLVLHAARVLGFPTVARIAGRYGLDAGPAGETLLDFEAHGWVRQLSFGDSSGWSLTEAGRMTFNDHTDWRWDERVLRTLASLDSSFGKLCGRLSRELERFDGYAGRYSAALTRARAGQNAWVDGHDRDSCHIVWIQFHEDLLATLGIPRGTDG